MSWTLDGNGLIEGEPFVVGDTQYPGNVFELWTTEELEALGLVWTEPTIAIEDVKNNLISQVNTERDRRIDNGFIHLGHPFQSKPSDRENVMGACQAAQLAIMSGAQAGNLRWADPDQDFVWIAADNALVTMDAFQVVALFQKGVTFKSTLTFYARYLKDTILASTDPLSINIMDGWPS